MKLIRHSKNNNIDLISKEELSQLFAISTEMEHEKPVIKKYNAHHLYMQFLYLSLFNQSKIKALAINLHEQKLLEQIAVCCEMEIPISVTEVCLMRQFGCSSTIHYKLQKLIIAGLIYYKFENNNRRKKIIRLTEFGIHYFKQIEDCLDQALISQ